MDGESLPSSNVIENADTAYDWSTVPDTEDVLKKEHPLSAVTTIS